METTITVQEASKALGLTDEAVLNAIKKGNLQAHRDGRFWRIPSGEIERYRGAHLGQRNKAKKRPIPVCADTDTLTVPLSNGTIALIEGVDRDLYAHRWSVTNNYAARHVRNADTRCVYMHRVVAERMIGRPLLSSEQVDHINHNTTDNRRANLRIVAQSQNMANAQKKRGTKRTATYKGVSFHQAANRWRARVANRHLGFYDTPEEAARAYDQAAHELYGEFAHLNFPEQLAS